jgi:Flp pilus assembly protein TadD
LPYLEEAVRLAPNSVPALTALGRVQLERDDARAALALLRRAVEIDPRNADAWFQLARAHQRVGDRAAARAALEQYEKHK